MSSNLRVLAFDTSMGRPGVALVEVKRNKPTIIDVSHVSTNAKQPHGLRAEIIEAWAVSFIAKHYERGFDVIVREDFQGRSSRQNHPVFSAWGACDQALNKFGLDFTTPAISQSKVKRLVVGKGKAEKAEVEDAVRRLTGYKGEFACDDESDACAIALAYLIEKGVIDA
jgi:crossover junction endodeoxyribonuclease RuvC